MKLSTEKKRFFLLRLLRISPIENFFESKLKGDGGPITVVKIVLICSKLHSNDRLVLTHVVLKIQCRIHTRFCGQLSRQLCCKIYPKEFAQGKCA